MAGGTLMLVAMTATGIDVVSRRPDPAPLRAPAVYASPGCPHQQLSAHESRWNALSRFRHVAVSCETPPYNVN